MSGRNGRLRRAAARLLDRRTVRLRLTALYTLLFAVGGMVLVGVVYALVAQNLPSTPPAPVPSTAAAFAADCRNATDKNLILKCTLAYQKGVAAGTVDQRARALDQLLQYSLVALVLTTVLAAVLGWFLAGRVLRPVRAITETARRASQQNLGQRVALAGPHDELRELADTFDSMLGRLDAAFAAQRRFIADASHELRTPLTVMRAAIDVTLAKPHPTRGQLESMAAEVRQAAAHAESLIEALLTLARSDAGEMGREPVDLAVVAEDALDELAGWIEAARLAVDVDLGTAGTVGDTVLIERMIANLAANAVIHNAPGGWLQVRTGTRGETAFVTVSNGGPAIAPGEVAALLEPFHRGAGRVADSSGVGLGLAIVRSIVAAHAGRLHAAARPDGGLDVTVELPGGA
ncbi:sensor histidine kinase [Specibacter cremeus]|uniref:sensor histidine kinase n=1 Tax=Specibacter cremeus TaxID=1629051 RepID=UPI000F76BEE2|nr:ATP-binding protein [Specibacter cremeus]